MDIQLTEDEWNYLLILNGLEYIEQYEEGKNNE
jgi:hypothetical protein